MLEKKEISSLIVKSIKEVNRVLSDDKKLKIAKDMDLYGGRSHLDSMGLVALLVDLEQRLSEEAKIFISIMDQKAFSLKKSPFRNINTLTDFIYNNGKKNG